MGETNPDLEARILANPDDRDAYNVYGDWLSERGDPRGELIALQLKGLTEEAEQHITQHREKFLGELAKLDPKKELGVMWRWGFLDAVRIGPTEDYDTADEDFPTTYEKLMALPSIDLCREIVFGAKSYDDYPTSWSDCVEAMGEHGVPKNLQRLELTRGGYWDISSTELGDISPLYPQLKNLRELTIELGSMEFGTMDLPSLKKLTIITGGLGSTNLKSINSASWPNLETLDLCIGETGNDYGCDVQFDDVKPILDAENLPKVKHLAIANSSIADDVAKALPKSRILARLETLDLSKGVMTDDGANAILNHWDAFSHLRELDLSHGYFSQAVIDQLKAKQGPKLRLDDMQAPDEEYRYCEISE